MTPAKAQRPQSPEKMAQMFYKKFYLKTFASLRLCGRYLLLTVRGDKWHLGIDDGFA